MKGKLMTPLFYDHMFNQYRHRMRAILEREVSNETKTYRLWRGAGKPNLEYPRAENDRYILYVEINGYLVSLGMTDFVLIDHCGFEPAAKELYGGTGEREQYFDNLRRSDDYDKINVALAKEREKIERCGKESACQADYIQSILDWHVNAYLKARENDGATFPDFVGALVMDDLDRCAKLSAIYKANQQADKLAQMSHAAAEEEAYCEEKNGEAERKVSEAIHVIQNGGILKNETVEFYRSRYDPSTYSIINYLMRQYHIDVPLRTQGWINKTLASVTIENGRCTKLQYYRSKNGQCSQKFFHCMNELVQVLRKDSSDRDGRVS